MAFEKAMGWHDVYIDKHATYSMFYAPIALLIYFLALREKREKDFGGTMDFVQGFVSGLIMSAVIVLLTPLSQYISHVYISPDYFPNIIHHSVESGKLTRAEAEKEFHLQGYMMVSTLFSAIMGLLTSAVMALATKK